MPLLDVRDVEVTYQRSIIGVSGVSLVVPERAIIAVLGTNGAGKTTILRAISGFLTLDAARVTKGIIRLSGECIERLAPHETARRGIAIVPEREKVFPNLSVAENLAVSVAGRRSGSKRSCLTAYDLFPRLAQLRDRHAGLLSGGERQMLAIASALASEPRLLLIDELSLGLAPVIVEELAQRILEIRDELALSILLVEQSANLALGMSDYAYVLENGRVAMEGRSVDLLADPNVQALYLGQYQPPEVAQNAVPAMHEHAQ